MKLSWGTLHRQVLLTLSYSQVFLKPLTAEEIGDRLLSPGGSTMLSLEKIRTVLDELRILRLIAKREKYWQLNNRNPELTSIRKKRERLSRLKLQELQPFISFTKLIPWIIGVAVTGSVSVNNADAKDDVDLMIITQPGRLWLVRPLLVLFSFIKGKRRSWNKEEHNSWCLNLWLDLDSLQVMPDKRSVYTAHEVCQARWLVTKNNVEQIFLKKNSWVKYYLPNFFNKRLDEAGEVQKIVVYKTLLDPLLSGINWLAYMLQRWYMKRHMTTERVGLSYAFFHPRDTKRSIVDQWQKLLRQLS